MHKYYFGHCELCVVYKCLLIRSYNINNIQFELFINVCICVCERRRQRCNDSILTYIIMDLIASPYASPLILTLLCDLCDDNNHSLS